MKIRILALVLALIMVMPAAALAVTPSPEAPSIDSGDVVVPPSVDDGDVVVPSPEAPSVDSDDVTVPSVDAGDVDVFTSASVANYYGDAALTGDDLMNAVNSFAGFYLVSTVNPDGSANAAFLVFSIKKLDDKYYLQLGLAENQTKLNLTANASGVAVFAAAPGAENPIATAGARILFTAIEDQAVLEQLSQDTQTGTLFFEIVNVLPLG